MTPEEFRVVGHQLVDWVADYRASLARYPVMAQVEPGAIRAQLPTAPPTDPEDFAAIFGDLDRIIVPGLMHWQHPSFFGYFPGNSALSSVLGDYLSTGLGVLGLSWQAGPAITELEEVVTAWVRQMIGLSPAWSGVIQDTASTGSLVALLCARERTTNHGLARGGLQAEPAPLVIYASSQSHSSIEKAALLAGFGRENVRSIATDPAYAIDPSALDAAIRLDLAAGRLPCAVVATTGTTATTAMDPIAPIAATCREQGLWLHVDAAMAGSGDDLARSASPLGRGGGGGFGPPERPQMARCRLRLFALLRARPAAPDPGDVDPPELSPVGDGRSGQKPPRLGHPPRPPVPGAQALDSDPDRGVAALQARIRRDLGNAQWLADQIRAAPNWQVVAPVPLQTVCVRHQPAGLEGTALDRHTLDWVSRVNQSGAAYLTPATLDGRWMVRISIGAETTEREHVAALWETIQREVS